MLSDIKIKEAASRFGVDFNQISDKKDTSKCLEDQRFHYFLDNRYVLKVTNTAAVTEEAVAKQAALIQRYRNIGVYCPLVIPALSGSYTIRITVKGQAYLCYLEEFSPYPVCTEEFYNRKGFRKSAVKHLGTLAARHTGEMLMKNRSMWSLIELSPLDNGVDEKQENLNRLLSVLLETGHRELAEAVYRYNKMAREQIKKKLDLLPRCVFQGDLNRSNLLTDRNGNFVGLLDFNLAGTEVNINCFLNETMYYMNKEELAREPAEEIIKNAVSSQNDLLSVILDEYVLSSLEKELLIPYRNIIFCSFYPNVRAWISLLKEGACTEQVCRLLKIMINSSWS